LAHEAAYDSVESGMKDKKDKKDGNDTQAEVTNVLPLCVC
jgi:hypothetical protein